jgi:hypothetical protein
LLKLTALVLIPLLFGSGRLADKLYSNNFLFAKLYSKAAKLYIRFSYFTKASKTAAMLYIAVCNRVFRLLCWLHDQNNRRISEC